MSSWALQVGSTRVELPAGTHLQPGQTVRVHAGPPPGLSPSPLPVPGGLASPVAAASPVASPSAASTGAPAEVFLGPSGAALRQALQPGAEVDLVDTKDVLQSQYVLPR